MNERATITAFAAPLVNHRKSSVSLESKNATQSKPATYDRVSVPVAPRDCIAEWNGGALLWPALLCRVGDVSTRIATIKQSLIAFTVLVTCASQAAAARQYKTGEARVQRAAEQADKDQGAASPERLYDRFYQEQEAVLPPYLERGEPKFAPDALYVDGWTYTSLREPDTACNVSDGDAPFAQFLRNLSTGNLLNLLLENADAAGEYDRLVMCYNVSESDLAANGSAENGSASGSALETLAPGLRVPVGEAVIVGLLLGSVVFATIFGNFLVVLSVFTYRPLKNVPNILIASLAVSDFAVAFLVMPFNIYDTLFQPWMLGHIVCDIFTTSDVFFCTSSILNLCAIAVDRYHAIHDPLNYAQKRTAQRMIITVVTVYVASGLISVPPLLGWKEASHEHCTLSDNMVYVIISALGSFYIPCLVMCFVYVNIFLVARRRLRQRAKHSVTKANSVKHVKKQVRPNSMHALWPPRRSNLFLAKSKSVDAERGNNGTRLVDAPDTDNSKSVSSNENANCNQRNTTQNCPGGYSKHENTIAHVQQERMKSEESAVSTPEEARVPISTITVSMSTVIKTFDPIIVSTEQNGKQPISQLQPGGPSFLKSFAAERQKISLSRERKAARTLAILGGTFLISWLPFFIWYLLGPFSEDLRNLDRNWVNFLVWLGYANSATNPVLYTVFNADFRRAFQKLLHLPASDSRRQLPNSRKR